MIILLPLSVITLIFICIPLPALVVDVLLAVILTICFTLFVFSLWVRGKDIVHKITLMPVIALAFSILLLGMYVASTRLVLTQGGEIESIFIKTAGSLLTGSGDAVDTAAGFVVYLIILAIQFFLIKKSLIRISEIALRYALDSLPAGQLTIEAELGAGTITEEEATSRKFDLQHKIDFLGSMEAAAKYLSGNINCGIFNFFFSVIGGSAILVLVPVIDGGVFSVPAFKNSIKTLFVHMGPYITNSIGAGLLFNISVFFLVLASIICSLKGSRLGIFSPRVLHD